MYDKHCLEATTYMNSFWIIRDSSVRNAGATPARHAAATRRPSEQLALPPAILAAISSLTLAGCAQSKAIQLPPPEVLVAYPVQRDVPVHNEWVATLDGYTNAEIRPQVSGYLTKQNYKEGSEVSQGQVLFEIDPRPFQANLDRAGGSCRRMRRKWHALGGLR
jgi:membrane fusion protein (multidrug efflux system)